MMVPWQVPEIPLIPEPRENSWSTSMSDGLRLLDLINVCMARTPRSFHKESTSREFSVSPFGLWRLRVGMAFQAGESKRAQHQGREKSEVASSGMVGT